MYLLKLTKIRETECCYKVQDASFYELRFLGKFLEDFGFPHKNMKDLVLKFIDNPSENYLTGDETCIEKKDCKFLISCLYGEDEERTISIPRESLVKTLNLYWQTREQCPSEIIIKFDDSMRNPTIELSQ